MAYSQEIINKVADAPKTLGNQLGRYCVHLDVPVTLIAEATGATRQTVYNWFNGGEVLWAYRPSVETLLKILQTSSTAEEAWRKTCRVFGLKS